jgi:hypothetical protein
MAGKIGEGMHDGNSIRVLALFPAARKVWGKQLQAAKARNALGKGAKSRRPHFARPENGADVRLLGYCT